MNSPQLAIVARQRDIHVQVLVDAAAQQGIDTVFITGTAAAVTVALAALTNVVIIWRSSRLTSAERLTALAAAEARGCRLLNSALLHTPDVRSKRYQQQVVSATPGLRAIPSVEAAALSTLTFPVIAKLPVSSRGQGVHLLEFATDIHRLPLSADHYIYQSFIPNSGDYRVFMVGGVALGVMKRVAKAGEYRNNLAQGGQGEIVTDPAEHAHACQLGTRVAALFGLQVCGVDLIRDSATGQWFFLEVNTVPQWADNGFQAVTGVDVAAKIIAYVAALLNVDQLPLSATVSNWYESNMTSLPSTTAFHWWSRRYLWTGDQHALAELNKLKHRVLGRTSSPAAYFASILAKPPADKSSLPAARREVLAQYPNLLQIQSVLAKTLFARTIYNIDVKNEALTAIGSPVLEQLRSSLLSNPHHLLILSTYAINVLYFIGDIKPQLFVDVLQQGIASLTATSPYRPRDLVYLATHAVIGASQFYSQPITSDHAVYVELLALAEQIIIDYPGDVSLDAQLEFLVAHKILGTTSELEAAIMSVATSSTAPFGVTIVDQHKAQGANFCQAEHRNVLFTMCSTPWIKSVKESN